MADETAEPGAEVTALTSAQVGDVRATIKEWKEEALSIDSNRHYDWLIQLCDEWDSLKDTNLIDGEIFSMIAEALDIDGEKIPPSSYNDVIHGLRHELSRATAKAALATATLEAGGKRKQNFITVDLNTGGITVDEGDLWVPKHYEANLLGSPAGGWIFRMWERSWWEKLWAWVARRPKRGLRIAYFYNPKIKCIGRRSEDTWCRIVDNTWISEKDPTPNIPSVEYDAKGSL